jgi:hypothetical protein
MVLIQPTSISMAMRGSFSNWSRYFLSETDLTGYKYGVNSNFGEVILIGKDMHIVKEL